VTLLKFVRRESYTAMASVTMILCAPDDVITLAGKTNAITIERSEVFIVVRMKMLRVLGPCRSSVEGNVSEKHTLSTFRTGDGKRICLQNPGICRRVYKTENCHHHCHYCSSSTVTKLGVTFFQFI
jgi:hypothetical protein